MKIENKKIRKKKFGTIKKIALAIFFLILIAFGGVGIYLLFIKTPPLFANSENKEKKFFKDEILLQYGYEVRFNKVLKENGRILAVGSVLKSPSEKYQLLVVSFDYDGKELWRKEFGGSGDEWGYDVIKKGENYLIVGTTSSKEFGVRGRYDALLVEMNQKGDIIWSKVYGGPDWDRAYRILKVDDGYVFVGDNFMKGGDVIENFGEHDYWIVKLNDQGNIVWSRSFGGIRWDRAYGADYDPENKMIVVTGSSNSFTDGVRYDGYTIAYDLNGQEIWKCTLSNSNTLWSLDITISKSGIFVGGYVYEKGKEKSFVAKLSKLGKVEYIKIFSENTRIHSLKTLEDTDEKLVLVFSGYKDNGTKQPWHGQLVIPNNSENNESVLVEYPISSEYGMFLSTSIDDDLIILSGTNFVNGKLAGYIRIIPR